jgi:hypothetical protein
MSRKFDTALDDCMDLLRSGTTVEDCLARYPEYAEELRPLVGLAAAVKGVPTPRADAANVNANRLRMLEAVQNTPALTPKRGLAGSGWFAGLLGGRGSWPLLRAAVALTAILLLVGLSSAVLFASAAGSLPGQTLYPVKRFGESVRLSLTFSSAARQDLQTEFRLERQREVRQVLESGQQAMLEFRSHLEEIGDGYWIVGGQRVLLDDDTVIEGQVVLGATVIVRASAPGNGTLRAVRLQVLADPRMLTPEVTSTPTPTPTATPTPSLTPAATPTLTRTPTATSTPRPTLTATSSHTEEPVPTDEPEESETEEPEASYRRNPDETDEPEPTDHPDEDETDEAESGDRHTPDATDEPGSTDYPTPTSTDKSSLGTRLSFKLAHSGPGTGRCTGLPLI